MCPQGSMAHTDKRWASKCGGDAQWLEYTFEKKMLLNRWQQSEAVQLGKNNGMKGTKGIRLINKLEPAG